MEELKNSDSITGQYLNKTKALQENKFHPKLWFTVENTSLHNLKNITAHFPKNALTTVTGVSSSGKSSLVMGELVKQHPKAIVMDQKPIRVRHFSVSIHWGNVPIAMAKALLRQIWFFRTR